MTTNIVDVRPDDLELGHAVEVQFEARSRTVWLPLFRPTVEKKTGPQAVDEIAPQDFGKHVLADAHPRRSSRTRRRSPGSACRRSAAG